MAVLSLLFSGCLKEVFGGLGGNGYWWKWCFFGFIGGLKPTLRPPRNTYETLTKHHTIFTTLQNRLTKGYNQRQTQAEHKK